MYSAVTFKGLMTLSSARLKPSRIFLKSPWCLATSVRTASLPSSMALVSATPSDTSASMLFFNSTSHS